jgi:hypothetical protein
MACSNVLMLRVSHRFVNFKTGMNLFPIRQDIVHTERRFPTSTHKFWRGIVRCVHTYRT